MLKVNKTENEKKYSVKDVADNLISAPNEDSTTHNISQEKYKRVSSVFVVFVLSIVWGFVGYSYLIGDRLLSNLGDTKINTALDKTPMAFLCIIFIAASIFTDSIVKTLKYDTRPNDNIFSSIFQSLVMAFAMIWAFIKG